MPERVLISGTLLGTRALISEHGGDPDKLAADAGLPGRVFDEHDIFMPAGRIIDFLELAARACSRPDFGLLHAQRLPLAPLGQSWMLMRSAETVREALQGFVNIYGLYTDAGSLHMRAEHDGLWLNYVFLPVGRWGETQIVHLTLARLSLFVGEILGRSWRPQRVLLRHVPDNPDPFVSFFGRGVRFGQDRDAFLIGDDTLAEHRAALHKDESEGDRPVRHSTLLGTALQTEVKSVLGTLLRHGGCSIETLSGALGLSVRTLQRRLAAAGVNYRELVDAVRADLGWRQVRNTDLSLAVVSDLLGYDSQPAFSRAFRRWYQMSPREARAAARRENPEVRRRSSPGSR